jgi:NadR type nicotinamide-nucleotide adenylyltransferase
MEKGTAKTRSSIIRIVITGPECTGKSTLAAQLAVHYNTTFIPEYAREYIENLGRPYTYDDVVRIAERQIREEGEFEKKASELLFYDTYLIITKVWFDVVYKRRPDWIDSVLQQQHIHLFLLCDTDIPWHPDRVRENGGAMRNKLFRIYRQEIEKFGFPYAIISGKGEKRLQSGIQAVELMLKNKSEFRMYDKKNK